MWRIPVIVTIILLTVSCSKKEEKRLLMADMLLRDHQEVTFQTDSAALSLVEYFTQHGSANDQMCAFYLLGRVYDCQQKPILALRFYQEAIEKADTIACDIDFETLSRAHAHTAKLFLQEFGSRPTLALEDARKAYHYSLKAGNQHMTNISHDLMGNALFSLGMKDSLKLCHPILYYNIYHPWAKKNKYIDRYKSFAIHMRNNLDYVNKLTNEVSVYYDIPWDSVPKAHRPSSQGTVILATYHAIEKADDRDSIMRSSDISSYMNMVMDSQRKVNRQHSILVGIIVFLLLSIIVFYLWFRLLKNREREHIKDLNTQYSLDLADYRSALSELEILRKAKERKDNEIEVKQKELDDLRIKLSSMQNDYASPTVWNVTDEILLSPFITSLHKKASLGQKADGADIHNLIRFAKNSVPVFINALSAKDERLDEDNLILCILTKLRFLSSEQSALMGKSPQATTNRKVRLLKKLFGINGGAKQFDYQVRMLGDQV